MFRPSQDSSVWLGLTSREQYKFIIFIYIYIHICIYIYGIHIELRFFDSI